MKLNQTRHYLAGRPIGLFGAGHMGRAVARGLLELGLPRSQILLCHRGTDGTHSQLTMDGLDDLVVEAAQLVSSSGIVLYLVRPQQRDAIENYRVPAESLFVSFLAGIPLSRIPVDVSDDNRIRVMTSAPDTLRRRHGLAALYAAHSAASAPIPEMLESLGLRMVTLSREDEFHSFTALGPCLPIALMYWRSLGNTVDELEILEVARRHALRDLDAILQWALSTDAPGFSKDELSRYLAEAVTPGGVTDAIICAMNRGMRVSQALDQGIERSRELATS